MKSLGLLTATLALLGSAGVALASSPSTHSIGAVSLRPIPAATQAVLYDQTDAASGLDVTSQNFEAAFDTFDNQAADDFVVPAGATWTISGVDAVGDFSAVTPTSFNVFFYSDAAGLPGTLVASSLASTFTGGVASGDTDVITLGSPAVLTAGTYWVSVQANLDFTGGGQWYWAGRNTQSGSGAAWQNPGVGFGVGCATWGNKGTCLGQPDPDQLFRLNGTSGTGGGGGTTFTNSTPVVIPDNTYDGTLGSMGCSSIDTSSLPAGSTVTSVTISTSLDHTWVGDLTAKLVSPAGSILGVFSRPGFADTVDDGSGGNGDSSNLIATSPLSFSDAGTTDAELMGSTLTTAQFICQDDTLCSYHSNPGSVAVPPANFAGFNGQLAGGTWQLCVGDAAAGDTGNIDAWSITLGTAGGVVNHTVTPSVGTPSGTITPASPQTVADGATTQFTLAADAGNHIVNVTGTCNGTLAGNTFTTAAVTADCTVIANFAADGSGGGLTMTVGLTPGGDGTTCGTQTSAIVNVGDVVDFCYTVTNNSTVAMTLSTLDDSIDGNIFSNMPTPIAANGGVYVYHRSVTAAADGTYNETWTARDILPGYVSNDTAPSTFVDISATGTGLDLADDGNATITSPFPFSFYGASATQFCVGNNGVIVAASTCNVTYTNAALPGTFGGASMAVFWDDLFNDSGNVYWQVVGVSPNRQLIVEWDRPHYEAGVGSPSRATIEAILGEDGSLSYQYNSTVFGVPGEDGGASATIGLQNADGTVVNQYSFDTALAHADPSAISWVSGAATVLTATASVSLDVGAPVIGVTPTSISQTAPSGSSTPVTTNLSIANTGDRDLTFTITEAPGDAGQPAQPTSVHVGGDRAVVVAGKAREHLRAQRKAEALAGHPVQSSFGHQFSPNTFARSNVLPAGSTDCGPAVEGIIIHDDGTAENGYSGNATTVSSFVGVDKFTPSSYPATFTSVCVSFITNGGATSVDYEVVVYDDTGADGGPGTELGAVSATGVVTGISPLTFNSVDISALSLNIPSGSVYIGVRYNPETVGPVFVASDESGSTSGNGYASFDTGSGPAFTPIGDNFPGYVALMVRAVEGTSGCVSPADVPWLSVSPTSGTVIVGAPPATAVATLNPTGLADGLYTANICVASNDPAHHTTAVPVEFVVGQVLGTATVAPSSLAFTVDPDDTATDTLTVSNTGNAGSHITFTVTESVGACGTPSDVPWLSETPTSGDATTTTPVPVTVTANATGLASGTYTANICIASNDAVTPVITVPVTLTVNTLDLIFADGFEGPGGGAGTYTDRTTFLTHVAAGYYDNPFANAVPGASPPLTYTSGGWAYTVDASSPGPGGGLYNDTGIISTNLAADSIVVTFTGDPVTAVGGNVWATDIAVQPTGTDITVTLSDATTETFTSTGPTDFRGFTTVAPITTITIEAPDDVVTAWPTLDNLIIGTGN